MECSPGGSGVKTLKVWSADKRIRKAVIALSFDEFVEKSKAKFDVEAEVLVNFVLNEDGTEIDSEYYTMLANNMVVLMLKPGESWMDESSGAHGCRKNEEVQRSEVMGLLEKISNKQKKDAAKQSTSKKEIALQAGWMLWRYSEKRFIQVKNSSKNPDIATKIVRISPETGYDQTLQRLCDEFFPNGKSCKGRLASFKASLGNAKGKQINKINFTIEGWLKEVTTQRPRLYLLLKKKTIDFEITTDSDSDELPDLSSIISSTPHVPCSTRPEQPIQPSVIISPVAMDTQEAMSFLKTDTPTISFKKSSSTGVNLNICSICFERQKDAFLNCRHTFCLVCATQMQETSPQPTCPICRTIIERVCPLFN